MAYVAAAVFAGSVSHRLVRRQRPCTNVPWITWTAAYQQTDRWDQLCRQTLQGTAPGTAEVTEYALMATRLAKSRYENTFADVDILLWPGNTNPDALEALDSCKVKYGVALSRIASVADQLSACDFAYSRQFYIDAEVAVRTCQDELQTLPNPYHSWPLFAKVSGDHELTMHGRVFIRRYLSWQVD